jgi:glucose/arabinose dehydrogenase
MQDCKGNLLLTLIAVLGSACGGGGGSAAIGPPDEQPPPPTAVPEITTQRAFEQLSFSQPVALLQAPGDSSRWFVVEKNGVVRVFANNPNSSSTDIFVDISGIVNPSGEGGLLGAAFHPNFPMTPEVFLSYTRSGTGTPLLSVVSRFFSTDNGQTLNAGSEEVILTLPQEASNHNGGDLKFGPDGNLYIGFGDSGGSGDPREYAQDTSNVHGSIVRVDIEGGSPYAIPAGNPFSTNPVCTNGFGNDACPEIYAWGLRNPWRFNFDTTTLKLWAGDVGQGDWEEIDVISVGENFGWNVREGAHCFPPGSSCAANFSDPITEYGRNLGQSVTGGYVYRGSAIPGLVGWYVFGDFVSGRIFAIPENSQPGVVPDVLLDTAMSIVSFAEDSDRELYVLDFVGTIHEIRSAP